MTYANGRLSFVIDLAPGSHWYSCLLYDLDKGTRSYVAPDRCVHDDAPEAAALPRWRDQVTGIRTSNEEFYRTFHQAVDDMAALRLPRP